MKNNNGGLPNSLPDTLALAESMMKGLGKYEVSLGIIYNTQAVIGSHVLALTAAMDLFSLARKAKRDAYRDQRTAVEKGDAFMVKAVDQLKPVLGRKWSAAWTTAGFTTSLSLPGTLSRRLEVLRSLESYFKNHPTHENTELEITQDAAKTLREALSNGLGGVSTCKAETRTKRGNRSKAFNNLRKKMRGLSNELTEFLTEEDSRWTEFGLHVPADTRVPGVIENLDVEGGQPGQLLLEWDGSARAERFYVEILVKGLDTQFRRVATVLDTSAKLDGLPPDALVQVRIIAANAAGEGAASEVVEEPVPALAQAA